MLGRLYLVATPRPEQAEAEFLARIAAALAGGVDTLQLRCKDWEARPYIALGEKVRDLARQHGIPFLINDRIDVALACGADGVHLGQQDLPPQQARQWADQLAPKLLLGRSTHAPAQLAALAGEPIDYFAVGPVYATPTKPGRPAAGLEYVLHVAQTQPTLPKPHLPWYAIGGIDQHTLGPVLAAGATRIAVVRAVLDAKDPAEEAAKLLGLLGNHAEGQLR